MPQDFYRNKQGQPLASDVIHRGAMEALKAALGQQQDETLPSVEPPNIFRQPVSRPFSPSPQPPTLGSYNEGIVQGVAPPWMQQDIVGGSMTRGDGPGLSGNDPRAIAALKATAYQPAPRIPTGELYKQSFRPAGQVAPGANQWAQGELKERIGADEFTRLLGQKEQESFRSAQSQMHPAVQANLEAQARRASYPAQAQAEATKLSGLFGLQREQERGAASVESARARRDALGFQALQRRLDTLSRIEPAAGEKEEIADELASTKRLLDLLRSGELFLSDFLADQDLDALISEENLDEDLEF